jgi:glucose-1-phosphate adenylyltransferase
MDLRKEVVAIILGGGRGTRLFPLTKVRAKPAVEVAGKYRLVDIPISNCIQSQIDRIFVLTQFQSASLNRHIFRTYRFESFGTGFIEVLPAQQHDSENMSGWYQGTADAVRRNLNEFEQLPAKDYLILAGDQLYRMDFADLLRTHRESQADVTVAVTPIAREACFAFGIMRMSREGRITEFVEKPKDPKVLDSLAAPGLPPGKTHLASMGIYVIRREKLAELVRPDEARDFGKDVIPSAIRSGRVQAHVFPGYWEDIGTVSAYYREMIALTDPAPAFDLFDPARPILTRPRFLPPTRVRGACRLERALVSDGCVLEDCSVVHSVVGVRSIIRAGAQVTDSVLLGHDFYEDPQGDGDRGPLGINEGAVVRGAIIDKNVRIGKGARILNAERVQESERDLFSIRDGIVCVPKGAVIPPGMVI